MGEHLLTGSINLVNRLNIKNDDFQSRFIGYRIDQSFFQVAGIDKI